MKILQNHVKLAKPCIVHLQKLQVAKPSFASQSTFCWLPHQNLGSGQDRSSNAAPPASLQLPICRNAPMSCNQSSCDSSISTCVARLRASY